MTRRPLRACAALLCAGALVLPLAAPASAAPEGSYWYDALHIADNHRIATGKGTVIGLLDGPVDPTAPELAGQRLEAGPSFCDGLPTPLAPGKDTFHGTSMAALLIGSGRGTLPDGSGIRGVAPDATVRVYPIDDGTDPSRFECFRDTRDDVEVQSELAPLAVRRAVDDGVDVLSLSFTMPGPRMVDAVQYALDKGVVVVASVGGPSNMGNPAGIGGVVAVTASDQQGRPWPGAAKGSVSVAAPGVDVSSGSVDARGRWSSRGTGTGTSPATAIVAGMVAVVHSRYPQATSAQLVQHLLRNTTTPGLQFDTAGGWGNASLTRMLKSDPARWPDHLPFRGVSVELLEPQQRLQDLAGTLDPALGYEALKRRASMTPEEYAASLASAAPSASAGASAAPAAAPSDRDGGGSSPVLPLVGGLGALALAGLGAGLWLRTRSRSSLTPPVPSAPSLEGP